MQPRDMWVWVLLAATANAQAFFKPRWHTPNDRALDGTPCSKMRPARTMPCPTLCVRTRFGGQAVSQEEFEKRCVAFNDPKCECEDWDMNCQCEKGRACPKGQSLFPSGECRTCPEGFALEDQGGDLHCKNATKDETFKFDNPCECLNNGNEFYRPCQSRTSVVEEYYKTFDLEGQWTMASCAKDRGLENEITDVDMTAQGSIQTFNFPLLYQNPNKQERDFGFIQCPHGPQALYSYATPVWWAFWAYHILWVVYTAAFALYKSASERERSGHGDPGADFEKARLLDGVSPPLPPVQRPLRGDGSLPIDRWQIGYRDDGFGASTFVMLVLFALFHVVFLVVQILDVYGMFIYTLCPTSVSDHCRDVRDLDPNNYYALRSGFPCAAGCLFGEEHSTGKNSNWPYWRRSGGAAQYKVFFVGYWPAVIVFFCALRALKSRLRCYFRVRCKLSRATTVVISEPCKDPIYIEPAAKGKVSRLVNWAGKMHIVIFGKPRNERACKVHVSSAGARYFDFRCQRYSFDQWTEEFLPARIPVGKSYSDILWAAGGLTDVEAARRREVVGSNIVFVRMRNLLLAIFHEAFNYFYFYQFFGLAIAFHYHYWIMAASNGVAVIFALLLQVFTKRSAKLGVKRIAETSHPVTVLRNGRWRTRDSPDLVPGDVVQVHPGPVACDIALITGRAVVDESSLTGESAPVPKSCLQRGQQLFSGTGEDARHSMFSGTTVQAASPGDRGYAAGVVIATGSSAVRGKLLSDVLYRSPIVFQFDQEWKVVFWILIMVSAMHMCICFFWMRGQLDAFFQGTSLMLMIVSPLIPASFVVVQARAARRLAEENRVFCVEPARTAVAGKVKYACFDKTGTLTQSGLVLQGVLPVLRPDPSSPPRLGYKVRSAMEHPVLQLGLATCHELDCVGTSGVSLRKEIGTSRLGVKIVGSEVDRKMFNASGFEFENPEELIIKSPDGSKRYQILRRFEFDRSTMTMSAIVENLRTTARMVVCKGNGEGVAKLCAPGQIPGEYQERVNSLAADGMYVLGFACKNYDGPEDVSQCERAAAESNLTAGGIICFRNELKHDTAEVISVLKRGRVRPVMVTGDAPETAVRIARECGLSTSRRLLKGTYRRGEGGLCASVKWEDYDSGALLPHDLKYLRPQLEANEAELVVCGDAFDLLSSCPVVVEEMLSRMPSSYHAVSEEKSDALLPESQMDDLLLYTRIFARMKPEQKVEAVSLHMKRGITAMCGDGANDAAAMQKAHVGMALSAASGTSGEVSTIVAHFATPSESLYRFTDLLRVGRGALATIMHAYKYLIAYGQQTSLVHAMHGYLGARRGEAFWISSDIIMNILFCGCIVASKPSKKLMPNRPTSRLLGAETLWSLVVHILINFIFALITILTLFQQEWFRCKEYDASILDLDAWWLKGDNYETSQTALLVMFSCINAALVFNFGFDYRRKSLRNGLVPVFWAVLFVYFSCILLLDPNWLGCLYRTNCGDQSLLHWWHGHGWIQYNGSFSTAPEGCPCDEQIIYDDKCEAEYIDCPNSQYNAFYHHNIVPSDWRWKYFSVFVANLTCVLFFEGVVMVGPIRGCFRRFARGRDTKNPEREPLIQAGGR